MVAAARIRSAAADSRPARDGIAFRRIRLALVDLSLD